MGDPAFLFFTDDKQIICQERISRFQERSRQTRFAISGVAEESYCFTVHDHYCGVGRFNAPLKKRQRKDLPEQMGVERFGVGCSMRETNDPAAIGRNQELEEAPVTNVNRAIAEPGIAVPCWILPPNSCLSGCIVEPVRTTFQNLDVELPSFSLHNRWK